MSKTSTVSLFLILVLPLFGLAQPLTLHPVWETDTTLRTPESVLFHPGQQVLYVSCINGPASPDNKSSYIAKVGLNGKVIQLKFANNLNVTKGMGILGAKLYVTEMSQVAEIELATGKVLHRYPIDGAIFLNDLAVDSVKGLLYVTDSKASNVWVMANGKARLLWSGHPLDTPNGLLLDGHQLLIGNGDGSLQRLDLTTNQLSVVTRVVTTSSIDGLVALGKGTFLMNEVAGKLWSVQANGVTSLLLSTTTESIKSADTAYNPATQMLFIPTLTHNTVRDRKSVV